MGAAPSRESVSHSLPQAPFYGQRQQIVLLPLLRQFFPSADSPLFKQFYDARCDPAVRYYHYAKEGTEPAEGDGNAAVADGDAVQLSSGKLLFECTPPDVFPPVPCSIEELYEQYVLQGGERLVFDSDEAMLHAYEADPTSVHPLPCAVAFLYHFPTSTTATAAAAGVSTSDGTASVPGRSRKPSADAAVDLTREAKPSGDGIPSTSYGPYGALPEGCVEVLGCQVKVTGFIGDVRALQSGGAGHPAHHANGSSASCGDVEKTMMDEMDLFLTKSAGDHNRTHVLLSSIYTYAEQWQRACLHIATLEEEKAAAAAADAAATTQTASAGPAASEASPEAGAESANVGSPLVLPSHLPAHTTCIGTSVFDATRSFTSSSSTYYKKFMQSSSAAAPSTIRSSLLSAATNTTGAEGEAASAAKTATDGADASQGDVPIIQWALPPLSAICMRSRRANVPLLCFLREIRATLLSMHLCREAVRATSAEPETHEQAASTAGASQEQLQSDRGARALATSATDAQDLALTDLLMWLEEVTISSREAKRTEGSSANSHAESFLSVYAAQDVVQALVEHVMDCLLHNLNPLEILRARQHQLQLQQQKQQRQQGQQEEGDLGDGPPQPSAELTSTAAAVDGAAPLAVARTTTNIALLRLPDEDMVVEQWPTHAEPDEETKTSAKNAEVAKDGFDLVALRHRYWDQHLFWIVGVDEESRRAATASLEMWQAQQLPLRLGYGIDEEESPTTAALNKYRSPCTSSTTTTTTTALSPGVVLELLPASSASEVEQRVLRLCRLPLEELLLGELRYACKLAREAEAADPHWVRNPDLLAEAATTAAAVQTVAADGGDEELPPRPPEALDIVGDGTSCLWKVVLATGAARVIAVTPYFLKPIRKKHAKKKAVSKTVAAHGTALNVFFQAPSPSAAATTGDSSSCSSPQAAAAAATEVRSLSTSVTSGPAGVTAKGTPPTAKEPAEATGLSKPKGPVLEATVSAARAEKEKEEGDTTTKKGKKAAAAAKKGDAATTAAAFATTSSAAAPPEKKPEKRKAGEKKGEGLEESSAKPSTPGAKKAPESAAPGKSSSPPPTAPEAKAKAKASAGRAAKETVAPAPPTAASSAKKSASPSPPQAPPSNPSSSAVAAAAPKATQSKASTKSAPQAAEAPSVPAPRTAASAAAAAAAASFTLSKGNTPPRREASQTGKPSSQTTATAPSPAKAPPSSFPPPPPLPRSSAGAAAAAFAAPVGTAAVTGGSVDGADTASSTSPVPSTTSSRFTATAYSVGGGSQTMSYVAPAAFGAKAAWQSSSGSGGVVAGSMMESAPPNGGNNNSPYYYNEYPSPAGGGGVYSRPQPPQQAGQQDYSAPLPPPPPPYYGDAGRGSGGGGGPPEYDMPPPPPLEYADPTAAPVGAAAMSTSGGEWHTRSGGAMAVPPPRSRATTAPEGAHASPYHSSTTLHPSTGAPRQDQSPFPPMQSPPGQGTPSAEANPPPPPFLSQPYKSPTTHRPYDRGYPPPPPTGPLNVADIGYPAAPEMPAFTSPTTESYGREGGAGTGSMIRSPTVRSPIGNRHVSFGLSQRSQMAMTNLTTAAAASGDAAPGVVSPIGPMNTTSGTNANTVQGPSDSTTGPSAAAGAGVSGSSGGPAPLISPNTGFVPVWPQASPPLYFHTDVGGFSPVTNGSSTVYPTTTTTTTAGAGAGGHGSLQHFRTTSGSATGGVGGAAAAAFAHAPTSPTTMDEATLAAAAGSSGTGYPGQVNVTVRVRHHTRTESVFSEGTENNNHLLRFSMSQSMASSSAKPSSPTMRNPAGAALASAGGGGNEMGGMPPPPQPGSPTRAFPQLPQGLASSTRSGETGHSATARRTDARAKTFRWDWRTAGLADPDDF